MRTVFVYVRKILLFFQCLYHGEKDDTGGKNTGDKTGECGRDRRANMHAKGPMFFRNKFAANVVHRKTYILI